MNSNHIGLFRFPHLPHFVLVLFLGLISCSSLYSSECFINSSPDVIERYACGNEDSYEEYMKARVQVLSGDNIIDGMRSLDNLVQKNIAPAMHLRAQIALIVGDKALGNEYLSRLCNMHYEPARFDIAAVALRDAVKPIYVGGNQFYQNYEALSALAALDAINPFHKALQQEVFESLRAVYASYQELHDLPKISAQPQVFMPTTRPVVQVPVASGKKTSNRDAKKQDPQMKAHAQAAIKKILSRKDEESIAQQAEVTQKLVPAPQPMDSVQKSGAKDTAEKVSTRKLEELGSQDKNSQKVAESVQQPVEPALVVKNGASKKSGVKKTEKTRVNVQDLMKTDQSQALKVCSQLFEDKKHDLLVLAREVFSQKIYSFLSNRAQQDSEARALLIQFLGYLSSFKPRVLNNLNSEYKFCSQNKDIQAWVFNQKVSYLIQNAVEGDMAALMQLIDAASVSSKNLNSIKTFCKPGRSFYTIALGFLKKECSPEDALVIEEFIYKQLLSEKSVYLVEMEDFIEYLYRTKNTAKIQGCLRYLYTNMTQDQFNKFSSSPIAAQLNNPASWIEPSLKFALFRIYCRFDQGQSVIQMLDEMSEFEPAQWKKMVLAYKTGYVSPKDLQENLLLKTSTVHEKFLQEFKEEALDVMKARAETNAETALVLYRLYLGGVEGLIVQDKKKGLALLESLIEADNEQAIALILADWKEFFEQGNVELENKLIHIIKKGYSLSSDALNKKINEFIRSHFLELSRDNQFKLLDHIISIDFALAVGYCYQMHNVSDGIYMTPEAQMVLDSMKKYAIYEKLFEFEIQKPDDYLVFSSFLNLLTAKQLLISDNMTLVEQQKKALAYYKKAKELGCRGCNPMLLESVIQNLIYTLYDSEQFDEALQLCSKDLMARNLEVKLLYAHMIVDEDVPFDSKLFADVASLLKECEGANPFQEDDIKNLLALIYERQLDTENNEGAMWDMLCLDYPGQLPDCLQDLAGSQTFNQTEIIKRLKAAGEDVGLFFYRAGKIYLKHEIFDVAEELFKQSLHAGSQFAHCGLAEVMLSETHEMDGDQEKKFLKEMAVIKASFSTPYPRQYYESLEALWRNRTYLSIELHQAYIDFVLELYSLQADNKYVISAMNRLKDIESSSGSANSEANSGILNTQNQLSDRLYAIIFKLPSADARDLYFALGALYYERCGKAFSEGRTYNKADLTRGIALFERYVPLASSCLQSTGDYALIDHARCILADLYSYVYISSPPENKHDDLLRKVLEYNPNNMAGLFIKGVKCLQTPNPSRKKVQEGLDLIMRSADQGYDTAISKLIEYYRIKGQDQKIFEIAKKYASRENKLVLEELIKARCKKWSGSLAFEEIGELLEAAGNKLGDEQFFLQGLLYNNESKAAGQQDSNQLRSRALEFFNAAKLDRFPNNNQKSLGFLLLAEIYLQLAESNGNGEEYFKNGYLNFIKAIEVVKKTQDKSQLEMLKEVLGYAESNQKAKKFYILMKKSLDSLL